MFNKRIVENYLKYLSFLSQLLNLKHIFKKKDSRFCLQLFNNCNCSFYCTYFRKLCRIFEWKWM